MTTLLLILLAAAGIGGVALSGGGGGGGGDSSSAVVQPVSPLGANATVKGDAKASGDIKPLAFTSNAMSLTTTARVLETAEDGTPVAVEKTLKADLSAENLRENSSAYGSYYEQNLGTFPLVSDDGNTQVTDLSIGVNVGGKKAGLSLGEFGYQKRTEAVQNAQTHTDYAGFYAYNPDSLAGTSETRASQLNYEGAALGYHVRTPQRGQAESGEVEGTSSFRIDLNTQRLEGKIISYLNKSPWYTFSVRGTLTGALFAWDDIQLQNNATSASGNTYSSIGSNQGGGVRLAAGNQDEIVGDLSLTGKNSSGDDLRTYLAFGGKRPQAENTFNPRASMSPLFNNSRFSNIVFTSAAPASLQSIPFAASLSGSQPGTILVDEAKLDTGHQLKNATAYLSAANFTSDTSFAAHYSGEHHAQMYNASTGKWQDVTHLHELYFGGGKLGMKVADFGLSNTFRSSADYDGLTNYQDFILYDRDSLYKGTRNAETDISMSGHVLMVKDEPVHLNPLVVYPGDIFMTLNLALGKLSGRVTMNEREYDIPSFTGTIRGTELESFSSSSFPGFTGWGKLLQVANGPLEAAGVLGWNEALYSFGLKEGPGEFTAISPLLDYSKYAFANLSGWQRDQLSDYRIIHNGKPHTLDNENRAFLDADSSGAILWRTGVMKLDSRGKFVYFSNPSNYEQTLTLRFTTKDINQAGSTGAYNLYKRLIVTSGYGDYNQQLDVLQEHDLYLGGEKAGLTRGEFGFFNYTRNSDYPLSPHITTLYSDQVFYDKSALVAAADILRSDTVAMSGKVMMVDPAAITGGSIPVFGGDIGMRLNFADKSLTGQVDMGRNSQYNLAFGGSLQDTNQLIFTGKNGVSLNEGSRGVLLKGDGEVLESVGRILHEVNDAERTYTYGMREVRP